MATLFTVGHGARSIEEFVALLQDAAVRVLVDVRRYPGSRRHPHFGREPLSRCLQSHGIRYEWWGESLGGRRKPDAGSIERHPAWDNDAFRAYAAHMETPEFQATLRQLLALAEQEPIAVMCAETLWWRCHRRLIADAAVVAGSEVVHLGAGDKQPHRPTPSLRVDENGLLVYDRA